MLNNVLFILSNLQKKAFTFSLCFGALKLYLQVLGIKQFVHKRQKNHPKPMAQFMHAVKTMRCNLPLHAGYPDDLEA
jgi:hypothetical protein